MGREESKGEGEGVKFKSSNCEVKVLNIRRDEL